TVPNGPTASFLGPLSPTWHKPRQEDIRLPAELRLRPEGLGPAKLTLRLCALARPGEQQPEVVANRLAVREPAHERAEAGERGRQVVLVEASDSGAYLRLVVIRPEAGSPGVDALGGVLVTLALQERALQE